jgi:hypothetical protein
MGKENQGDDEETLIDLLIDLIFKTIKKIIMRNAL